MTKIGQGIPRADGIAKITGKALYVDDIRPEGCLYGATVRSPHPHAEIEDITMDANFDWEGITVVTAEDIPGENVVYLMTKDQPALAENIVRHASEPVALVAAPTRERALEAVRHVNVRYKVLPPLLDFETSIGSDTHIYEEHNIFKEIHIQKGDVSRVSVGKLIEGEYSVGHQEQMYIEPQGIIASPREDGGMTILGSMQCPYYIVKALEPLLGHDNLNVVQAATGGGFGGKEEYPSMISAHAVLLALKTGQPVKLIYRRDEDMQATTKRHPAKVRFQTRVDDQGNLLSMKANLLMDGGAYNTLSPVVLSRAILHLTGPYRVEHVKLDGFIVATHTPPNGAFRGFGAPQAHFAIERHMDKIARTLGLDPIELRRRNLLRDGDTTATGQELVDTGGLAVLDAVLECAQNKPIPPVPARLGVDNQLMRMAPGQGLSLVFHGCGFTGNGEAFIKGRVALELHQNEVRIFTSVTDIGQGPDTVFPQIVAEELGLDLEYVKMMPHDTKDVPDSGPTVASRTTMVIGRACQVAARKLKLALEAEFGTEGEFAALLKRRQKETGIRVEHQYEPDPLDWDGENYRGAAYPTYGWNCTWVDLAVDLDTGEVQYKRVITATDVGRAINPVLAAGQLEGGTLQALGWATSEEVVVDDVGLMKNNRFTNYIIPTALDAPAMETILVEIPFAGGPFGAKGIGEIPMDGPAAAVAQAVENATRVVLNELPLSPERILERLDG